MRETIFISIIGPNEEQRRQVASSLQSSLVKRGYQVALGIAKENEKDAEMIFLDNNFSDGMLKIEIGEERVRAENDPSVFAIIGDKKFRVGRPEFKDHELNELTNFLEEQFLKKRLLD